MSAPDRSTFRRKIELVEALRRIATLRPVGDVDTCKNPRKLVEQMERIAIEALDLEFGDGGLS